jgi:Tfp pilus assembly protein PilN
VWAALHRQEERWRLLVARRKDRWEILDSRTLTDSELASLPATFEQHGVSHLVRIAPGRETIARCVSVPGGDEAGLVAAVGLLAEAELPAILPSYRRAAGVLPNGNGEEMRAALLTGWMNGGASPATVSETPENWTTPAAALALLRGDSGRAAVYSEQAEGLMCLLVPGPERSIARVLVEEPADDDTWAQKISSAVSEAAQMAGAPAGFAQNLNSTRRTGPGRRLFLESGSVIALKAKWSGLREDQGWLDDFGLALGALMVAGSEQASIRSLAALHAQAPAEERTLFEATSLWLGRPANAWGVIAAACVLMLLGPLGLAAARKTILEHRADKVKDLRVGAEGVEKKAAMYEQFNTSRWPMTKLLSDVSQATPVGVVVTNLQLTTGQGLIMQGTAENPEQINTLVDNLGATRVFGSVSPNRVESKSDTVTEFDISAKVIQPNIAAKTTPEMDYKTKSLAVRLYGEGASNTTAPASAREERSDRGGERSRRRDRSSDSGGDRADRSDRGGGGGDRSDRNAERDRRPEKSTPSEPPPPLTDADIAKMDFSAAVKEWVSRQTYVQKNPSLAAGVKQRLNDEVAKLKEQRDKMKSKAAETPAAPATGGASPAPATPPATAPSNTAPAPSGAAPAAPPPPAPGGKS